MLVSNNYLQKITRQNEDKVEKRFKRQGFRVTKLDKVRDNKRPDFLICRPNMPKDKFICEVKTIFSVGTLDNGKYHISTYDLGLGTRNKGPFVFDSFPRLQDVFTEAKRQFEQLIMDNIQYKTFPFVVALFPDFFADSFDLIPRDVFGLKLISAVIQLERDYEIKQEARKMSLEKLERIIKGQERCKFPAQSLKWKVLRNSKAENPIRIDLLQPCVEN